MRRTLGLCCDYVLGEYQTSMRSEVERACREREVHLLTFCGGALDSPVSEIAARNFVFSLASRERLDGVIVLASVGSYATPARMQELVDGFAPLPVVSLGAPIENASSILVDNELGMALVVEHLISAHELRRIAFIRGPETNGEAEARFRVYKETLARHAIPFDPSLVVGGNFEIESGTAAVHTLLDTRGARFEALVAANDNMAAGAIHALTARRRRVPQDVAVAAFDDAPIASFTNPPLTSVRQPYGALARAGVDAILARLDGATVEPSRVVAVELVTRQSCGCGLNLQVPDARRSIAHGLDSIDTLRLHREQLVALVAGELALGNLPEPRWAERVIDAVEAELADSPESLASVLDSALATVEHEDELAAHLHRVISILRERLHGSRSSANEGGLEPIWQKARVTIADARTRAERQRKMKLLAASTQLQESAEAISTCLAYESLTNTLTKVLPKLGIHTAFIAQFADAQRRSLVPRLCLLNGQRVLGPAPSFAAHRLCPESAFESDVRHNRLVLPLSAEEEVIGIALLEGESASSIVYESLRDQIGGALRVITLHEQVLSAVADRERAERGRLSKEVEISGSIRARLRPKAIEFAGLELDTHAGSSSLLRSSYLDFASSAQQAWFGLGSVSGAGLATSLILLMLRSSVATLVGAQPERHPEELRRLSQRVLAENVGRRLLSGEDASFGLVRYDRGESGGRLLLSSGLGAVALQSPGRSSAALDLRASSTLELLAGDVVLVASSPWNALGSRPGEGLSEAEVHALILRTQRMSAQEVLGELRAAIERACPAALDELALLALRVRATR